MAKVLSKSGDSLADVYDVEGSIAGIERLQSEEVHLTHDMGQTLFSERLASRMLELSSGVLSQSTVFNVNFSIGITSRLLAIQVLSTNSGRLVKCSVAITSPPAVDNMDVPIWYWDPAAANPVPAQTLINVLLSGTVGATAVLNPVNVPQVPQLLFGNDSPRPANTISLRGETTAFGAGTVTTRALLLFGFPQVEGLSSRGLPIPSW